ncbi:hypothetical protein LLG95_08150 [bacterium]|nr:hypothetical protein [bacterium]
MDRNDEREAVRRLRELARRPGPRASPEERSESARRRLRMAAADLQLGRIVHRNPLITIGLVTAAGFVVGYYPRLARALVMGAASAAKNLQANRSRFKRFAERAARKAGQNK